jgi:hypothetical protein
MCAGTTSAGGAGGAVITGTWITGAGVTWGCTVVVDVCHDSTGRVARLELVR